MEDKKQNETAETMDAPVEEAPTNNAENDPGGSITSQPVPASSQPALPATTQKEKDGSVISGITDLGSLDCPVVPVPVVEDREEVMFSNIASENALGDVPSQVISTNHHRPIITIPRTTIAAAPRARNRNLLQQTPPRWLLLRPMTLRCRARTRSMIRK